MKIVIIGGTGLIGQPLVGLLRARGHEVIAASPSSGVDALTGAGLAQALNNAAIIIDVSNAPSFEDAAALAFFRGTTGNLLAAARDAANATTHSASFAQAVSQGCVVRNRPAAACRPRGDYMRYLRASPTRFSVAMASLL